jgi:hypothetical protein
VRREPALLGVWRAVVLNRMTTDSHQLQNTGCL